MAALAASKVFDRSPSNAVVMGDSLIDNGSNTTNGRRNNRSIVMHALRALGMPFNLLAEAGYPGKRTDEIFTHWDEIVTANNPGVVFWESGTNDFNNGDTASVTFARLRAVHLRAKQEGRRFIYIGMPPLYYNGLTASFLRKVRQLAKLDPTFEYTGGSERLLNYNGTPAQLGVPTQLTNATADGTHPTAYGAPLWANQIVDYFNRRGYPFSNPFATAGSSGVANSAEYLDNLIVNGLVGAAGVNWASSVSPAATRVPTDSQIDMGTTGLQAVVPGRIWQTVWAPGVAPADQDTMSVTNVTDNNGNAAQYAGRTFVARCYVKVSATGGKIHDVHLRAIGYTWSFGEVLFDEHDNKAFDLNTLSVWSLNADVYEGVFETEPFTLPSTWTSPTQAHFIGYVNVCAEVGATVTVVAGALEMVEVFSI